MRRSGILLCALAALALGSGCKDTSINPEEYIFPTSNVSYARDVQPFFNITCAITGCHGQGTQQSMLRLNSYQELMDYSLFEVIPKDPENSELVKRIEGRSAGQRMPLYRQPLTQNQINGIRAWIGEGALNN